MGDPGREGAVRLAIVVVGICKTALDVRIVIDISPQFHTTQNQLLKLSKVSVFVFHPGRAAREEAKGSYLCAYTPFNGIQYGEIPATPSSIYIYIYIM